MHVEKIYIYVYIYIREYDVDLFLADLWTSFILFGRVPSLHFLALIQKMMYYWRQSDVKNNTKLASK